MDGHLSPLAKIWLWTVWLIVCLHTGLSFILPHSYFLTAFGDVAQCILLLSVLLSFLGNVTTRDGRPRLFWMLMALGCAIWWSAQVLWTWFEVFLHREVPNPFLGDVAFFLHLVPMMGALAVQPEISQEGQASRLSAVDFVLLLVWWLYFYLFMVIPWQYVWRDEAIYGRSFDIAYVMEHFVFIVSVSLVWRRSTGAWRVIYRHFAGASFLYALSSIAASVAIDLGLYHTGGLYDIPLVVSMAWFTTIGVMGRRSSWQTDITREAGERQGVWVSRLAIVAALSLPLLAGWAVYGGYAPPSVRAFRLILTLVAILVIGTLRSLKQHNQDKELARINQELRDASFTDVLTGTKNRRFLTISIEADAGQAARSYSNVDPICTENRDLIFYFIDVDHFKEVNDQYGHDQGDELLAQIARRISSAIRHSDVLIRWGGEEFLVVSRCTNREEGTTLAARVLHAVGTEPFRLKDGQSEVRTCSIGWAAYPWFVSDVGAVPYEGVLRFADSALYRAKAAGRNQAIGILPTSATLPPGEINSRSKLDVFSYTRTLTTLGPSSIAIRDSEKKVSQ